MPFPETEGKLDGAEITTQIKRQRPPNLYATSIHVLVSAVLKLSAKCKLPPGRRVFRGLGRMQLGSEWFKIDSRGTIRGVELGFMSTTLNEEVALEYSGASNERLGTVLQFDVGAVDCGARLDGLSQYPGMYLCIYVGMHVCMHVCEV